MIDFTNPQFYYLALALIGAGIFGGYTAGLFGVGGGVVLVPALITILPYFGTSPIVVVHMAVGTSLALIVPGAIMASRKQYRMGKLDLKLLKFWIQAVIVGVVLGSILINYISAKGLKIFFTGYLLITTIYASLQREIPEGQEGLPARLWQRIAGLMIGTLSVLLGIGGGTLTVPFFKFFHYPLKKAIALSTATGLFIGLGGGLGVILDGWNHAGRPDLSLGYVHVLSFILIAPMMMIFAPLGARTANGLADRNLKKLYIAFLAFMTGYMIFKLAVS